MGVRIGLVLWWLGLFVVRTKDGSFQTKAARFSSFCAFSLKKFRSHWQWIARKNVSLRVAVVTRSTREHGTKIRLLSNPGQGLQAVGVGTMMGSSLQRAVQGPLEWHV